ncbi:MAG: DNA recombination protein RmuC [Gammaproteobacteria bacterium]|nr:MAG: DNA recombination protein RmuC [Gammaproteobacteria bacterium]
MVFNSDIMGLIFTAAIAAVFGALVMYIKYQRKVSDITRINIKLENTLENERRLSEEKLGAQEKAREELNNVFASISRDALKQNSEEFLKLAEQNLKRYQASATSDLDKKEKAIEHLVKPIHDALEKNEQHIMQIEKERKQAYGALTQHLESMSKTQKDLEQETRNLVQAFRRPEVRGQWGELTLRRLAELAGMMEHCDFYEQENLSTEEGRLRPDMIVRLPGEGVLVVDAKTPMSAYLDAIDTTDEEQRKQHIKRHARHVHERIKELAAKAYWDQFSNSPEFVILFIPGEQFLNAALDSDRSLYEEALRQKVIIASPNNFIALLRTTAAIWRQEKLAENAQEIRQVGEELYGRLAVFGEHLSKLGKNLNTSVDHYNKAVGSYEKRILPSARKFTEMGISGKKTVENIDVVDKLASLPSSDDND